MTRSLATMAASVAAAHIDQRNTVRAVDAEVAGGSSVSRVAISSLGCGGPARVSSSNSSSPERRSIFVNADRTPKVPTASLG
jgi:hypothetical protein